MVENKRGITAEDLYELKSVSDPKLSPDGKEAVYVVTEMDKEKNDYISNLFFLDIETGKSRPWTFGKNRNTAPRWSPDGKNIVFVSDRSDKNQLYLLSRDGGEAKQLTSCRNGAISAVMVSMRKENCFLHFAKRRGDIEPRGGRRRASPAAGSQEDEIQVG